MSYAAVISAVAAIASAAGTAISQSEANAAAKKQQRIIENAAEEDARINQRKQLAVEDFTKDTFAPEKRQQVFEQTAADNETSLIDSLLKAQGGNTAEVKTAAEGSLSSDYTRAAGEATAAAHDDILKRARLMARSNAPGIMFGNEALKGGQLASDLAGYDSKSSLNNKYAQLGVAKNQSRGSLAGGLLQGAGSMGMAAAGQMGGGGSAVSTGGLDMFNANANGRIMGPIR
jgi:hypothetical protein